MKHIFAILLMTVLFLNCNSRADEQKKSEALTKTISGEIQNGLRIVNLKDVEAGNLTFYRGDYLVIKHDGKDTLIFTVDELGLTKKYPAPEGEKRYAKLKKTGTFKYSLNDIEGKVKIIEYTQSQYKAINASEAKELIQKIDPYILDVRTPHEYNRGHLKGAQLLPVQVIQKEYTKLMDYKEKPILIYCASGNRSTVAARILIKQGFKRIYNMRYGIGEWQRNGYEIVK